MQYIMKKFFANILLLACALTVQAQTPVNYDRYYDFMKSYKSLAMGINAELGNPESPFTEQMGKPAPAYDFGGGLSSKALKGRFVILNFWSTWCGGCRVLSCYLDTVMVQQTDIYTKAGVQIIGVDYLENMIDKGLKAKKWWKDHGIHYPNVMGKGVDECGKAFIAGHPTAIVIDEDGIMRYRCDGAGEHTAGQIAFAVWALKLFPESGLPFSMATAEQFAASGEYDKATYVLWNMEQTLDVQMREFEYSLKFDRYQAQHLYGEIKKQHINDAEWTHTLRQMADKVVEEHCSMMYKTCLDDVNEIFFHAHYGTIEKYETIYTTRGCLSLLYGRTTYDNSQEGIKTAVDYLREKNETELLDRVLKIQKETKITQ